MKRLLFVRLAKLPGLVLFLCLLGSPARVRGQTVSLVLSHVTVIDATGPAAQPDRTVLLAGDRLLRITQESRPNDVRVIDGRGKFLIPGLCDMHVHLAGVTADPKWSRDTLLPLLLVHGVTTVRDMGGNLAKLAQGVSSGTPLSRAADFFRGTISIESWAKPAPQRIEFDDNAQWSAGLHFSPDLG